ncbi:hypothetical protein DFP73DRAFT_180342 [Morchella snyderi]|nr:hypothetical protein DFP73DRAFT_180342 [Morchella snyderi]
MPTPESSEEGVYIFSFSVWPNSKIALSSSNKFVLVETPFVFHFFLFFFFPSSEVRSHPRGKFMTSRSGDPCLFSSFLLPIIFLHLFFFPFLLLHLADHDLAWLGPSSQGPCSLCRLGGGQLGCRLTSLGEQARRQAMTFDKTWQISASWVESVFWKFCRRRGPESQIPSWVFPSDFLPVGANRVGYLRKRYP